VAAALKRAAVTPEDEVEELTSGELDDDEEDDRCALTRGLRATSTDTAGFRRDTAVEVVVEEAEEDREDE